MNKFIFFLLTIILINFAYAEDKTKNEITIVTCRDNPAHNYHCYLPSQYDGIKPLPILYCFSPGGDGKYFVQRYQKVCENVGWIVVGSNNVKNGIDPQEGIRCIWEDTHQRFKIYSNRAYATGFSGGSMASTQMAIRYSDNFSGVIKISEGTDGTNTGISLMMKLPQEKRKHIAHWLMCGYNDHPCAENFDQAKTDLKNDGMLVEYKPYPGTHIMAPQNLVEESVKWMDKIYISRKQKRETPEFLIGNEPYNKLKLLAQEICKLKDLGKIKAQLTKKAESDNAEEKAEAERLIEHLKKYAEDFKEEANELKETEPAKTLELYQLLAKQFKGDAIGDEAEKTVSELKEDKEFQNRIKSEQEWAKVDKIQRQLKSCSPNKPLDIKNCADCKKNNISVVSQLTSACKQLMKQYPDTPAAKKCRDLMTELGVN